MKPVSLNIYINIYIDISRDCKVWVFKLTSSYIESQKNRLIHEILHFDIVLINIIEIFMHLRTREFKNYCYYKLRTNILGINDDTRIIFS